ncbi:kelch-like protein 24 [Glandiceps talaboti]
MDASDSIFNFKDTSQPTFVLRGLNQLRLENKFTDVVLCVGTEEITCHRAMLALCSNYFNAMFSHDMKERHVEKIMLNGVQSGVLSTVVEFLYTGCINITEQNAQSILEAASLFQISSLEAACSVFMREHMEPSNCLGILQFSYLHNLTELYKKADMFSVAHFSEVCKCDEFLQLPEELLLKYLSKELFLDSEEIVYEASLKWVKHDLEKRQSSLSAILKTLRLPFLSPDSLSRVANDPVVPENIDVEQFVEEAQKYQNMSFKELQELKFAHCQPRNYKEVVIILGAVSSDDVEIQHKTIMYDPDNRVSTQLEPPPFQKYEKIQTAAPLGSNVMVRTNLGNAWLYLPHDDVWTTVASPSQPRWHGKLVACNNHVYLVGGYGLNRTVLEKVEKYNPDTNTWNVVTTLPTPVVNWYSVVSCIGQIFVFGGGSSSCDDIPDIQCFNPITQEWSLRGQMRVRTQRIGTEALNRCIYTIGNMPYYNHIELFDVEKNVWRTVKNLNESRHDFCTAVCNGKLYIFGGEKEGHFGKKCVLNSVECYVPEDDQWTIIDSHEAIINQHAVTILHPHFPPSHFTGPKQH